MQLHKHTSDNSASDQYAQPRWDPEQWTKVSKIAKSLTRQELLRFYQDTGAVKARDLNEWTKEELLGVLDEIGPQNAERFIALHNTHRSTNSSN